MKKSKTCYIIASLIKEIEKQDDAIIEQIGVLNRDLRDENEADIKHNLIYDLAFKQGMSMALGQMSHKLSKLLKDMEEE